MKTKTLTLTSLVLVSSVSLISPELKPVLAQNASTVRRVAEVAGDIKAPTAISGSLAAAQGLQEQNLAWVAGGGVLLLIGGGAWLVSKGS